MWPKIVRGPPALRHVSTAYILPLSGRERQFTMKAWTPLVRYSPCYAHIVRATPQELISIWHGRRCICTAKVSFTMVHKKDCTPVASQLSA
jgi:hypothetical protein